MDKLIALLKSDSYAASFQSMGQYRTALLSALASPDEKLENYAVSARLADYPNLRAVLVGTVSGHYTEWPMMRVELQGLLRELSEAEQRARVAQNLADAHERAAIKAEASLSATPEIEALQRQIGYLATLLMVRGDTRTLPDIVFEAVNATADKGKSGVQK